jgi:hypothetical protein
MEKNRLKPHFQYSNCDSNHATAPLLFHFLPGVVFVEIVNMSDPGFWSGPGSPDCLTRRTAPSLNLISLTWSRNNATAKSRAPILGRLIYLNQFITILSI